MYSEVLVKQVSTCLGKLGGGPCTVRSHVWGAGLAGSCMVRSNTSWVMVAWPPSMWTDRQDRKHYLPATSLVGGKNVF